MFSEINASEDCSEAAEPPPGCITVKEAAKRAGIPSRTLYSWIKKGSWPVKVYKFQLHGAGRLVCEVDLASFETWLAMRVNRGK